MHFGKKVQIHTLKIKMGMCCLLWSLSENLELSPPPSTKSIILEPPGTKESPYLIVVKFHIVRILAQTFSMQKGLPQLKEFHRNFFIFALNLTFSQQKISTWVPVTNIRYGKAPGIKYAFQMGIAPLRGRGVGTREV